MPPKTVTAEIGDDIRTYWQHKLIRPAPDQSLFIVMRDYGRLGMESVSDPDMTREGIVRDIVSGQIERVVYVIEVNAAEKWSRDITLSIFEDVENVRWRAA